MKTKELYNAPEMEQLELRFEPCIIMGSGTPGDDTPIVDDGDLD